MITLDDINAAQSELEEVIRVARAKGLGPNTSRSWATSLGKGATLRRQYERQESLSRPARKGWNKVT